MGHGTIVGLCALLFTALPATTAHAQRMIVMVGDSTTFGTGSNVMQSHDATPRALEALLRIEPPQARFHFATVRNYGVGATRTPDWVSRPPGKALCLFAPLYPVVEYACAHGVPLGQAILPTLPRLPDLILVVLGTNDSGDHVTPAQTVDNLEKLRTMLAPVPTIFAPPFPRTRNAPASPNLVSEIRQIGLDRGLFTGPDWPVLPLFDGIHLTNSGYAAAAGLWLDTLQALPLEEAGSRPGSHARPTRAPSKPKAN